MVYTIFALKANKVKGFQRYIKGVISLTTIDELVKKFDNIYPVKEIKVSLLSNDGTSKVRTFFDIEHLFYL